MTERRCDGCAYFRGIALYDTEEAAEQGEGYCHHSSHNRVPARWWCEHYWPKDVPLPEPWTECCPHGDRGLCMYCLCNALKDRLP